MLLSGLHRHRYKSRVENDGEAFRVSNVLRGPAKHLSSRRESCLFRRFRFDASRNCIRFQQVLSASGCRAFQLPDQR